MRASKGYVAGVGTTSALMGAIGCAFAVLSTVVAVQGWPLTPTAPSVETLEQQAPAAAGTLPVFDLFAAETIARPPAHRGASSREAVAGLHTGRTQEAGGPLAGAFAPAAGHRPTAGSGAGPVSGAGPGASAASPVPGAGGGSTPSPAQPGTGSGGSGTGTPPPTGSGSNSSSSPTLGGTVTQVTSGAGTVVSQTGQQLSGTVQGTTGQLGAVVGQISPAAGQAVTQTGQVVGGVVSGATGAAGQVVSGTGTAVGRVLGGLGRARSG